MRKSTLAILLLTAIAVLVFVDQRYWEVLGNEEQTRQRDAALALCGEVDERMPPYEFTSDACSLWPNHAWESCCVEHDYAYWCGGDLALREEADVALRSCVNHHWSGMGTLMYTFVRALGIPELPLPFRWGYGHFWPEY